MHILLEKVTYVYVDVCHICFVYDDGSTYTQV